MNRQLLQYRRKQPMLFIVLIGGMTAIHWVILGFKIPAFSALPYWSFPLRDTPVNLIWIFLGGSALLVAAIIRFSNLGVGLKLFVIFVAGITLQFTFALSKNQGLDGLRVRMITAGHAEFATVASQPIRLFDIASDYERFVRDGDYQYIPSKPPGTLLFYMLNDRVASLLYQSSGNRLDNLRSYASLTWPVITYVVIFFTFLTAKQFFEIDSALDACLLYISIPSVNLITLHTDQTLYPLLGMLPFLLAAIGFRKQHLWISFVSGIAYYFTVFFSFGLTVIGAFCLLPFLLLAAEDYPKHLRNALLHLIAILLGAMATDVLARLVLGYNIYVRYTNAMQHHLSWKGWENTLQNFISANTTNLIEYCVWIGIPIALILFYTMLKSIKDVFLNRILLSRSILGSIVAGIFLLLLLVGKTKGESARLWLFMLPVICIHVAEHLNHGSYSTYTRRYVIFIVLLLEFGTTYFTLRYQDFF